MSITALPTAPARSQAPATFIANADAWVAALSTFVTEANTMAAAMNALAAGGAFAIPYIFSTTITDADPGAGFLRLSSATQNTSTVVRLDLLDSAGVTQTSSIDLFDDSTSTVKGYLRIIKASDPTAFIKFSITSLASPSGYRNVTGTVADSSSANPFTNGDSLILYFTPNGDKGVDGTLGGTASAAINWNGTVTVASGSGTFAADFVAAASNDLVISGTTAVTSLGTIAAGATRKVKFSGALTLTHNGTSLILPGSGNIPTSANDTAQFTSLGSGNWICDWYKRASGKPVISDTVLLATLTPTASAAVNSLGVFSSLCDSYLIIGEGIAPSANDFLKFQFAVAGSLDTGSNYFPTGGFSTVAATVSATTGVVTRQLGTAGNGANFTLWISNANDATTKLKTLIAQSMGENATAANYQQDYSSTAYPIANAITGIGFLWNGGSNFKAQGKIRIYGISNS